SSACNLPEIGGWKQDELFHVEHFRLTAKSRKMFHVEHFEPIAKFTPLAFVSRSPSSRLLFAYEKHSPGGNRYGNRILPSPSTGSSQPPRILRTQPKNQPAVRAQNAPCAPEELVEVAHGPGGHEIIGVGL